MRPFKIPILAFALCLLTFASSATVAQHVTVTPDVSVPHVAPAPHVTVHVDAPHVFAPAAHPTVKPMPVAHAPEPSWGPRSAPDDVGGHVSDVSGCAAGASGGGSAAGVAALATLGVGAVAAGRTKGSASSILSFKPGDRVTYVDEKGRPHAALVTQWWGESEHSACNLTYVDPLAPGDGVEYVSSVSRGPAGAPGRYWLPDGEPVGLDAASGGDDSVDEGDDEQGDDLAEDSDKIAKMLEYAVGRAVDEAIERATENADTPGGDTYVTFNGPVYFGPVSVREPQVPGGVIVEGGCHDP